MKASEKPIGLLETERNFAVLFVHLLVTGFSVLLVQFREFIS